MDKIEDSLGEASHPKINFPSWWVKSSPSAAKCPDPPPISRQPVAPMKWTVNQLKDALLRVPNCKFQRSEIPHSASERAKPPPRKGSGKTTRGKKILIFLSTQPGLFPSTTLYPGYKWRWRAGGRGNFRFYVFRGVGRSLRRYTLCAVDFVNISSTLWTKLLFCSNRGIELPPPPPRLFIDKILKILMKFHRKLKIKFTLDVALLTSSPCHGDTVTRFQLFFKNTWWLPWYR